MQRLALIPLSIAILSCAQTCGASTISPSNLNAGYGRRMGDENRPASSSTRDSSDNRVIINGLMADPSGLSGGIGLRGGLGDAGDLPAGSGIFSASAVANQINVVTNGSWNTIIVDAVQTNSGALEAKVGL